MVCSMQVTIKKGNHYSGFRFSPHLRKHDLYGYVQFAPSCRYDIGQDQSDWNKLTGFTLGCASNSVRIGWRWNGEHVELGAYIHENGKRVVTPFKVKCDLNVDIRIGIVRLSDTEFLFHVDEKDYLYTFKKKRPYWGWMMHPYFGGNRSAPHDVTLYLNVL